MDVVDIHHRSKITIKIVGLGGQGIDRMANAVSEELGMVLQRNVSIALRGKNDAGQPYSACLHVASHDSGATGLDIDVLVALEQGQLIAHKDELNAKTLCLVSDIYFDGEELVASTYYDIEGEIVSLLKEMDVCGFWVPLFQELAGDFALGGGFEGILMQSVMNSFLGIKVEQSDIQMRPI